MNNQTILQPTTKQIAVCAYLIWKKEGRPLGRDMQHWLQAEKQLQVDCVHAGGVLCRPAPVVLAVPLTTETPPASRRNKSKQRNVLGR